jgi:hypothetical protein
MEKVDQQSAEELEKQRKELEKAKEKFVSFFSMVVVCSD